MAELVRVGIAGTGSYVPDRVIPNSHFEDFLDTSDEWIVQRTGIRERRWAADDQNTSDLCVEAAKIALDDAGMKPEDLDLIVIGTLTPDYPIPSTACMVQDKLGAKNAGAWDVNAACTGFMSAFQTAESFVASGRARRVLVLGAEILSRYVDITDRSTCILFGDAAGAVILAPHEECGRGEILKGTRGADGSGYEFIQIHGGGSDNYTSQESLDRGDHWIHMRGRDVYRFAVSHMSQLIEDLLEGTEEEELGLIVPHQVNERIIRAALERLDIGTEKVVINIDRYGNTSAATVPLALDEGVRQGRIEPGKLLVMVAFGAGLTWSGCLLRW